MTRSRKLLPVFVLAAAQALAGCSESGLNDCLDNVDVSKAGETPNKISLTQACAAAIQQVTDEHSDEFNACLKAVGAKKVGTTKEKADLITTCATGVRTANIGR